MTMKVIMKKYLIVFLVLPCCFTAFGQKLPYQAFSGGTTNGTASSTNFKVSSAIGQPMAGSYSGFYTALNLSEDAFPVITHVPANGAKIVKGSSFVFGSSIEDPDGSISEAKVFYRKIGTKDFTEKTLTKGTGTLFGVQFTEAEFNDMGIEYYIMATDNSTNTSRSPESPTDYYRSYTEIATPIIPNVLLSVGTTTANYRMISIPFDYVSTDGEIAQLIKDDFETDSRVHWRMFAYDNPQKKYVEYPTLITVTRGTGYWFLSKESAVLDLLPATAPPNYASKLFQMNLKAGWNLIGNPYPVDISWTNVISYNTGKTVEALKTYTGTYTNTTELKAFQGGFVHADADITIEIPFAGQTSSGGRTKDLFSNDISEKAWELDILVKQGDLENTLSGIGMHPDAKVQKDGFDDLNPPRFMDYLEMNFPHPEHDLGAFCRDIVPTQEKFNWTFNVDASATTATVLQWDNAMGESNLELYLHDVANGRLVNMRSENSYTVSKLGGEFKIYFGHNVLEEIRPETETVSKVFPNPLSIRSGTALTIPFALPGNNDAYKVHVDIVNAKGQVVNTILDKTLSSGFYEATWNGQDGKGESCAAGLYVYRLSMRKGATEKNFSDRILISQ
jgi:hypothetical protein